MNPLEQLLAMLDVLATPAAALAARAIRDIIDEDDSELEVLLLTVAAQAVSDHGPEGIQMATEQVRLLIQGKLTELDLTDARMSHAILAAAERKEGLDRRKVREIFTMIGHALGAAGVALLGGALGGAIKVT